MIKRNVKLLKKEIMNSTVYQEYTVLKHQIKNSKVLQEYDKKIIALKKAMTNSLYDIEKHDAYLKDYNKYVNLKNNHPLIENFNLVKDELTSLLEEIREQIVE